MLPKSQPCPPAACCFGVPVRDSGDHRLLRLPTRVAGALLVIAVPAPIFAGRMRGSAELAALWLHWERPAVAMGLCASRALTPRMSFVRAWRQAEQRVEARFFRQTGFLNQRFVSVRLPLEQQTSPVSGAASVFDPDARADAHQSLRRKASEAQRDTRAHHNKAISCRKAKAASGSSGGKGTKQVAAIWAVEGTQITRKRGREYTDTR